MSLIYNNANLNNIYVGNSRISYVYIGNNLIYKRSSDDIPPIIDNTGIVTDGLIANLCEFDANNRKMIDTVGSYDLTINDTSTTINDNNLVVARISRNQGSITLPMTSLTQFTFSYVVESSWSNSQPTQIISGLNTTTFYMWLMTSKANIWYKNTKILGDGDYTTAGVDNIRFIDVTIDVTNGAYYFYINGELKVSYTGLSLQQATENTLYLNHTGGYTSIGDFTLYSFKVYNRCLNQDEIQKNIDYEKTRLGWT